MNALPFRRGLAVRALSLFIVCCAAYVLFVVYGVGEAASEAWTDQHVRGQGARGVFLYVGLTTLLTAFGVPRQACAFLGGYVFGIWHGMLWATVGTGLACCLCFSYARFLGRTWVRRRFGARLRSFNVFICQSPFTLTLLIRIMPLGSNFLTNFLAGVSPIPALPFLGGSMAGFTIQNLIFAMLGSGLHVAEGWRTVGGVLLYTASLGLGYVLYRRYKTARAFQR